MTSPLTPSPSLSPLSALLQGPVTLEKADLIRYSVSPQIIDSELLRLSPEKIKEWLPALYPRGQQWREGLHSPSCLSEIFIALAKGLENDPLEVIFRTALPPLLTDREENKALFLQLFREKIESALLTAMHHLETFSSAERAEFYAESKEHYPHLILAHAEILRPLLERDPLFFGSPFSVIEIIERILREAPSEGKAELLLRQVPPEKLDPLLLRLPDASLKGWIAALYPQGNWREVLAHPSSFGVAQIFGAFARGIREAPLEAACAVRRMPLTAAQRDHFSRLYPEEMALLDDAFATTLNELCDNHFATLGRVLKTLHNFSDREILIDEFRQCLEANHQGEDVLRLGAALQTLPHPSLP